jgi:hypothetical protein
VGLGEGHSRRPARLGLLCPGRLLCVPLWGASRRPPATAAKPPHCARCRARAQADENHFEPLATPNHSAGITGLALCVRKPLAATCGADRSVRLWNYLERGAELVRRLARSCCCWGCRWGCCWGWRLPGLDPCPGAPTSPAV